MYNYIIEFREFLLTELTPAITELEKIGLDKSRVHIQKLVYTNMVDRFDYCIDKTLLEMVQIEPLLDELLEKHSKNPMNEAEIIRLMMGADSPKEFAVSKLKETLRGSILRSRHNEKLGKLLKTLGADDTLWKKPRVNPSTGKILNHIKPQQNKIPLSVEGYADWVYCRRNGIVHGGNDQKITDADRSKLNKLYKVEASTKMRLSLSSIKTTKTFYLDFLDTFFGEKIGKPKVRRQSKKKAVENESTPGEPKLADSNLVTPND